MASSTIQNGGIKIIQSEIRCHTDVKTEFCGQNEDMNFVPVLSLNQSSAPFNVSHLFCLCVKINVPCQIKFDFLSNWERKCKM